MNNALQKYVEAAAGVTNLTKARAENIVKQLVRQGEAAADQAGDLVEELLDKQRQNREAITKLVKTETQRAVKSLGLATTNEVERLQTQVAALKRELAQTKKDAAAGQTAAKKSTKKTAAKKKSTAKKSSAKKSTKKSSKKSSG